MSLVTNVMLACSILEPEEEDESDFKAWLATFNWGGAPPVSVDDPSLPQHWYGGSKMMETPLYVGAFNYLPLEALLEFLRSRDWKEPDAVQLFIKEQESSRFEEIPLGLSRES